MIRYNYDLDLKKNKKKITKKKKLFTDGQTDGRTTQNYSSEPHKIRKKIKIESQIHTQKLNFF